MSAPFGSTEFARRNGASGVERSCQPSSGVDECRRGARARELVEEPHHQLRRTALALARPPLAVLLLAVHQARRYPGLACRPMPVIELVGLRKQYRRGRTVAIAGLDLEVPEGGVFGFLGPNGSGKTTTIRCVLGLVRPTGGRATMLGAEVPGSSPG